MVPLPPGEGAAKRRVRGVRLHETPVSARVAPLIRLRHLLPSWRGEGRSMEVHFERPSPRDSGERVPKAGEGSYHLD
jgi:hypothetical protein